MQRLCVLLAIVVASATASQVRAQTEAASDEHHGPSEGLSPKLTLHGFSDITLHADRIRGGTGGTDSSFTLGQLDFYTASHLADNLSFLGEVVFELDDKQDTVADVERVFIKYRFADSLGVAFGTGMRRCTTARSCSRPLSGPRP